jgi:hypothetical protein
MLDGQAGTAADYDAAVAAAQLHNTAAAHTAPSISYSHDEPPPDPTPDQWNTIERVRGVQLTQTDWLATQPPDTPQAVIDQIKAHQQEWLDFRQALRDIMNDTSIDPTTLVWPTLPPAPTITITPPPDFVQWAWPDFVPA